MIETVQVFAALTGMAFLLAACGESEPPPAADTDVASRSEQAEPPPAGAEETEPPSLTAKPLETASRAMDSVTEAVRPIPDAFRAGTKTSQPAQPPETLAIMSADASWLGVLTPRELTYRSPARSGWYRSGYTANVTSGTRELNLKERSSTLRVMPNKCADEELKDRFPHRVAFAHAGEALTGCAGPISRPKSGTPEALPGTIWRIVRVGEKRVPADALPVSVIAFGPDGTLAGTAACNDVTTNLVIRDGKLAPRPEEAANFEITEAECEDPDAAAFGELVYDGLPKADHVHVDGSRLIVALNTGRDIVATYLTSL